MKLNKAGLDIVGYKYDDQKYCQDCFYSLGLKGKIKFCPILRAVIILSDFKNCCKCGKELNQKVWGL